MNQIPIAHFSDVLCIWAYASQIRYDKLQECFPAKISMEYRFVSVFGDVATKIERKWSTRGGMEGYAAHVQEVGAKFEHINLHPRVWLDATPASSTPAHLYLCAVRLLEARGEVEKGTLAKAAWRIRCEFFEKAADIRGRAALLTQAELAGIPRGAVEALLNSGEAHASLAEDHAQTQARDVSMSPTLLLNEDRQRLAGNVGYRLLEANVRELLEHPSPAGSYC